MEHTEAHPVPSLVGRLGIDNQNLAGREPAICELDCWNCAGGIRFDDTTCRNCGAINIRFSSSGTRLLPSGFLLVAKVGAN